MKKINILFFALVVATLSSCQVIGGIFKAGFAVGIIAVLIVVFLVIWLVSAFRGKN
ncbi:MAG: lipoprotein [Bacteroidota bacterium]